MIEKTGCLMDLIFMHEDPQIYTAGGGLARTNDLIGALARVEGIDDGEYESLGRLIIKNDNELTTCVVVLSGWSLERREFLERLRGSGLALIIYAIGEGNPPEDALLCKVKWVRCDTIEKDLMTR
jgi:hypothetical protein